MVRVCASPILVAACVSALLTGCGQRSGTGNDAALYERRNAGAALSPGTQAVRIGDSGAAFPACAATGVVVNLSPSGMPDLPLRAAPFDEASAVSRLKEGARMFLCTRSLDQRWQGVVVPPADTPDMDCGVTAPVAAPRDYAGPCQAGWVLGTFLRPSGV